MGESQTFEEILNDQLGGFGKFQVLILVLVLIMEIPTAFVAFIPIFHGSMPETWNCDNQTVTAANICSCPGNVTPSLNSVSSIVTEWNLICGKVWAADCIISLQMFGILAGTLCSGPVADWYGRKFGLTASIALQALGQIVSAIAPNVFIYGFSRFLAGIGSSGFISLSSIYAMEFLTPKWRPLAGSIGPWGEGVMILALFAYFIRPWRTLTWVSTTPYFLMIVIYPLLPESPRWLLGQQKFKEAHKVVQYMAKINQTVGITLEELTQIATHENTPTVPDENVKRYFYWDMFREKSLRRPSLCFMSLFMTWAIAYFGISYNIKNMQGNLYFNVLISGISDATRFLAPLITFNRIGRRRTLAVFLILTAVFLVALAIAEIIMGEFLNPTFVLVLLFMGKFAVGGVRSCLRCMQGEFYPTIVRGMGSSLGGVAVGIGAIFAPQLAFAGSHWPSIPYFVFASTSLVGVGTSFLLPETKDEPLQEELSRNPTGTVLTNAACRRTQEQT